MKGRKNTEGKKVRVLKERKDAKSEKEYRREGGVSKGRKGAQLKEGDQGVEGGIGRYELVRHTGKI